MFLLLLGVLPLVLFTLVCVAVARLHPSSRGGDSTDEEYFLMLEDDL